MARLLPVAASHVGSDAHNTRFLGQDCRPQCCHLCLLCPAATNCQHRLLLLLLLRCRAATLLAVLAAKGVRLLLRGGPGRHCFVRCHCLLVLASSHLLFRSAAAGYRAAINQRVDSEHPKEWYQLLACVLRVSARWSSGGNKRWTRSLPLRRLTHHLAPLAASQTMRRAER